MTYRTSISGGSSVTALVAVIALVLGVQGCFDSTLPNVPPTPSDASLTYPGPDEYANYGYTNDPLIYAAYDPFLYGFWCPPPYYFYPYNRDYYRPGCYGGYCGPHGGKPPSRPVYPWPLVASHTPADQAPNPARMTASSAPSELYVAPQPTVSLNDDEAATGGSHNEAATAHVSQWGGFSGGGFNRFGGGGFGGGSHASFHR
jgi:hypothetical protein